MSLDKRPEEVWKRWTPAAQEKARDALREAVSSTWRPFYCPRPHCDGKPHDAWDFRHGRWDQHPPPGDWLVWLVRGGRGSGKTRTGAEWTRRRTKVSPRIGLIAPTGPDGRDIMVEGESGILAISPPDDRPSWEPSKKKLTWRNGAVAHVFSGEEPERLRGPQHYDLWIDEPAHMPLIEEVWSNALFSLRLPGRDGRPRICATTTPRPSQWMKDVKDDPATVSVVVSTYANIDNLAPTFAQHILSRYEGTRKGRQEIHGEILADVDGALWTWEMIEDNRVTQAPAHLDRIEVGIDPAGSTGRSADETGIIVAGSAGEDFYILSDRSGRLSPTGWADRATMALEEFGGDCLVPEKNYGGDMVRSTLENSDNTARIVPVTSRRGKVIRADPIVALYEKGRVHHVGHHTDLEDQLVSWVPGRDSPDRLDALVHVVTHLAKTASPAAISDPRHLRPRWLRAIR
jgi:phage terminase large subunit-like protein